MPTRAKHLPAEQRRAATIQAVVALAGISNPSDITTAAIAEQMAMTQGSLFRHFANKEAIWLAVMEWVGDHLLARLDAAVAGAESPLAALEAMFIAHIGFVAEYPGVPRMMFGELQASQSTPAKQAVARLIRDYGALIGSQVEAGKATRQIDPSVSGAAAAAQLIGSVQGLVMQSLLSGDSARLQREAPGVFAIFLRGIRSPL